MPVVFALLASLAASPVHAADEAAASWKTARSQGVAYIKRKLWPLAQAELEKAKGHAGGRKDFKTRYYLARAYYEQLIIEKAVTEARVAASIARDDEPRDKVRAENLRDRIEGFFAGVTVLQDDRQKGQVGKGIIHLEVMGGLINRKKKEQFARIRDRFAETPVELPATIWLPFGDYKANGAPFSIRKGESAEAITFLYLPDAERPSTPWWIWAGAATAFAGAAAATVMLLTADEPLPERSVTIDGVRFGAPE